MMHGQQVDLIKDINPGAEDGSPDRLIEYNDQLLLRATTEDAGPELWISDGTEEETRLLKDINPDSNFSEGNSDPGNFIEFDGRVFFSARAPGAGMELWVTDGTEEGTELFLDIQDGEGDGAPRDFVVFQDQLWFTATTADEGAELWMSDGTVDGTGLFLDINAGSDSGNPDHKYVTPEGGLMYFNAQTPGEGTEIWVSDGTLAGTELLKDIASGTESSFPTQFTSIGNNVFFSAQIDSLGTEVWRTDGTEEGTRLSVDMNPGSASSNPGNFIEIGLAGVAPTVLFFTADPDGAGDRLYVLDQTDDNTNEWVNLNQGNSMEPDDLNPFFGFLFTFTAFLTQENDMGGIDTVGRELFLADPFGFVLQQGNVQLMSLSLDNLDPDHSEFIFDPLEGYYYYTKETAASGDELFRVPLLGNFQLEEQLTEINTGTGNSNVRELALLGKDIYFQANDGQSGEELYGFIAQKGMFSVSQLPSMNAVNAGDTLDLGMVDQSLDTTLMFEMETLAEPIIEIQNVEVAGNGYSVSSFDPIQLIFGVDPQEPEQDLDTFAINYFAAEEGMTDVGVVTITSRFTDTEEFVFFIKAEVRETVSAEDAFGKDWQLAPNPVADVARLSGQSLESEGQIEIISNRGDIIRTYPIQKYQRNRSLILGELTPGTYYLRLSAPNYQPTTIPFIKQ
jgi:ELWxxDGT repeat protein